MADRPSRTFRASPEFAREARRLGLRVRAYRESRGLTLDRASSLAEVDLAHWQKIEAGTVNVTLATILRVAGALGVTVEALFARSAVDRAPGAEVARAANPVVPGEVRRRSAPSKQAVGMKKRPARK